MASPRAPCLSAPISILSVNRSLCVRVLTGASSTQQSCLSEGAVQPSPRCPLQLSHSLLPGGALTIMGTGSFPHALCPSPAFCISCSCCSEHSVLASESEVHSVSLSLHIICSRKTSLTTPVQMRCSPSEHPLPRLTESPQPSWPSFCGVVLSPSRPLTQH